ncbi:MAG: hypothetical protein AAF828_11810 [Bacteroidota bacterium]
MTHAMSKDLVNLLMQEGQFSLPSLGTFQLAEQAAIVSPIEGRIQPPAKQVTFNANLKIDDGRLLQFLKKNYQISTEEAIRQIQQLEEDIVGQLAIGELVKLEGIGRVFRDHTGEIRFNPGQQNLDKATFGLPNVPITPIVRTERFATTSADTASRATATSTDFTTTPPPVIEAPQPAQAEDITTKIWAFIQDHIWYIAGGTAVIFILGLWYINQRNTVNPETILAETTPTVPAKAPANEASRPTVETVPFTPPEVVETPEQPVNTANESSINRPSSAGTTQTAIIAVGRYGQQRNVTKMIGRIKAAGYVPYTKRANNLTRVGVEYQYSKPAELDRALADIRRKFTQDAFILERE